MFKILNKLCFQKKLTVVGKLHKYKKLEVPMVGTTKVCDAL